MKYANQKPKNRYFHYQKEILNTISEPASFFDRNFRYVFVNSAFNKFYGKETNEVIGKTVEELWSVDDFQNKIKPGLKKCLTGKPVFLNYEGKIPNGEFKILEMNYYPHRNSKGRIDGIISTAKDVTEHKQAERALKESEIRFKELNATKDKLFSIIGHDLKGPLNNILGFSELIEQGFESYSTNDIRQYNKLIFQLSHSISDLLENLLTWSRAQRNIITVNPHNITFYFTVEKCLGLLIQNAIQKEIRIKNNVLPDTVIFADEEMITSVIRNLISNAIKFTHRGGTILIQAQSSAENVIIAVKDNGTGISEDKIPYLFHPSENHSCLGTEGEKGTGLGLLICKDFIERNSGNIWVESEPDKGTTFFIALPGEQ